MKIWQIFVNQIKLFFSFVSKQMFKIRRVEIQDEINTTKEIL